MIDRYDSTSPVAEEFQGEVQEVLREKERNVVPPVPTFSNVMKAIHQEPSLATDQPIPFMRRVRSCGPLIRAQFRLLPRYIILVEIVIAAGAVVMSNTLHSARNGNLSLHVFSNMLMLDMALTIILVFPVKDDRELMLSMPLGPQVVVATRLVLAFISNIVVGGVALLIATAINPAIKPLPVMAQVIAPMTFLANIVALLCIWQYSGVALLLGVLAPLLRTLQDLRPSFLLPTWINFVPTTSAAWSGIILLTVGLLCVAIFSAPLAWHARLAGGNKNL
ncbi:hypothetical protein [Bifidobacterium coryneforme]|uniref:hypothetical protein n=1 Tax=Bifidobacterium coryneforme TaxID=1687 RepID=UPI0004E5C2CE|nr:hypothetical protein [Bifidobacterium coryneforme]AII74661.1 hypothetical protein BCOR_0648 [Bifidobacterium coryneforme]